MENLDAIINEVGFKIANILDENLINKLIEKKEELKKENNESKNKTLKEEINKLQEKLENENNFLKNKEKERVETLNKYFIEISNDIYKLLFLKQLLEKALIYARYHSKILKVSENE